MTSLLVQLSYTIAFDTAYHIGSGYGLAGLIDAGIVRRRDGSVYVPGSSLKGRLRARSPRC
ncbi:MAG: RAMP superfamily CRISPR-associated protein [Caldilineaceae bacterium]